MPNNYDYNPQFLVDDKKKETKKHPNFIAQLLLDHLKSNPWYLFSHQRPIRRKEHVMESILNERQAEARALVAYPPLRGGLEYLPEPDFKMMITDATQTSKGPQPRIVWSPLVDPPTSYLREMVKTEYDPIANSNISKTEPIRQRNWLVSRKAVGAYHAGEGHKTLYNTKTTNGLVVVLGTGPSLGNIDPSLLRLADTSGAVLIGVNQIADYTNPTLLDYLVVMSPRADATWWLGRSYSWTRKVAFIGTNPLIADGDHKALHWFNMPQPGCHWFRESWVKYPRLPLFQSGNSVATQAYQLACRIPGVKRIAMCGVDLSYPAGMARPGVKDESTLGFDAPEVCGGRVKTEPNLYATTLALTGLAAFAAGEGIETYNATNRGLLGTITMQSKSGADLSIKTKKLEQLLEEAEK